MTEGIDIFDNGSFGIHDTIYNSPMGRTNGNYLKRKVNEMIRDSYQRYRMNELNKFWNQKPGKLIRIKRKLMKLSRQLCILPYVRLSISR